MTPIIRDAVADDLPEILALNEQAVPAVNSIPMEQLEWFALHAAYFRVADGDGLVAAFLIGLRPGTAYESPNYRWFTRHYDDFAYIDRIAVAEHARRYGLATRLYDDFRESVGDAVDVMTCEVNLRPPNETSMRFHERYGFRQIASQETDNGAKEVALMEKRL